MNKRNPLVLITLVIVCLAVFSLSGCVEPFTAISLHDKQEFNNNGQLLSVHIIDVGQGDSIYVSLPNGETMLIDGGDKTCRDRLLGYLSDLNVTKIDYCIGTHPHADHIGSLDDVIRSFEIEKVIMPKVQANTRAFEDLLLAIQSKNMKIQTAKAGLLLFDYEGVKAELLAPVQEQYQSTNNYSAVVKLTYGNTAFLFCGDAEQESEEQILSAGFDLSADVLKVGHHGSVTSTSKAFLQAVNPQYAAISCGNDNSYGHPHSETVEKLMRMDIETHRTDLEGTILFVSDGNKITVESEK